MKLPLFAALLAASLACAPAADAKLSRAEAAMARNVAAEKDRPVKLLERPVNQKSASLNPEWVDTVGTNMRGRTEPMCLASTSKTLTGQGRPARMMPSQNGRQRYTS